MQILLAYKSHTDGNSDPYTSLLPIGLGYLAAVLRSEGHSARLANLSSYSWQRVELLLQQERPELVAISQFTHNRHDSVKLAELVKRVNPDTLVVLGGPHATHCCAEVLHSSRAVDAVILGEGEETLSELVRRLSIGGKECLADVSGIASRRGEEIVRTNPRPPIRNLDNLPFPALAYDDALGVNVRRQLEFIVTSRGCPSSCAFCASPGFWGKSLRFRSPASVVEEIRFLRDRYGLLYFSIRDDTFTADRERAIEFCRLLIAERLFILWNCQSRVSAVDEDLLLWMKRAGCECVQFGVESGSPAVLKTLGKRVTPDEVRRAAAATRRAGIRLSVYLITGVPGETEADLQATLNLIDDIRPQDGQVSPLAYYPGTALFSHAVKGGAVDEKLFQRERGEAFFVRSDSFVARSQRRILARLEQVAMTGGFGSHDFSEQKGLLGYCHATNIVAGETYEGAGKVRRAEREYREIVEREADNPWGWLALAELYENQGAIRLAKAAWEKVLEIVPGHLPACEALGELYRLAGDFKSAQMFYRRALLLDPGSSVATDALKSLLK